ncbi:MAG: hypothetical protein Q9157_009134, partial [Trypethelium eluteriae]
MSSAAATARGRGGKFRKPKRGGGKHFSRNLRPLDADGAEVSMWADPKDKEDDEDDSDDEEDSEESSDDSDENSIPKNANSQLSREERKAAQRAKKEAAIAKAKQRAAAPGDLPPSESSSSEEDDDDDDDAPANPNHTAKARAQLNKPTSSEPKDPSKAKKPDTANLSRREREALQAQQAKLKYQKLHAEGKTDEARADLERLRL